MLAMRNGQFLGGLAAGVLATLAAATVFRYAIDGSNPLGLPPLNELQSWSESNLGHSIGVFALVLGLYLISLMTLAGRIRSNRPMEEVTRAERLTDTWTSLFFGIGIIWTAIGMRSALVYALGDPYTSVQTGAFAVLQRMVDGGILLALSTTIVGGIGGYLMRVVKEVTVGGALQRYYEQASREPGADIQATLNAIEAHLQVLSGRKDGTGGE